MKVIAVVFWATVGRGIALQTGNATEGGASVNGGDAEQLLAEDDFDDAEMQGWVDAERIGIDQMRLADGHVSFSTSLQTMDRLLASRPYGAEPMQISAICERFRLDSPACERVGKYLGHLAHVGARVTVPVDHFFSGTITTDRVLAISVRNLCTAPADKWGRVYQSDFCKLLNFSNSRVLESLDTLHALFKFGDRRDDAACYPTIYKTRLMSHREGNYVLLNLNHVRHWTAMQAVRRKDVQFSSKRDKLVWRGVSTGTCNAEEPNSRMMLCRQWFKSPDARVDIGFSRVVQNCRKAKPYVKGSMSMQELLWAKYILVVNGNDKASGLNWALASNSVPFMVEPDIESWILESSLKAWEHYVPIKPDFSDLSSQVDWAVNNAGAAERIAKAGKQYIQTFLDIQNEMNVQGAVLTAYLDRVTIEAGAMDSHLEGNCS